MIEPALKEVGLSDKEIAVFIALLEYGKLSPARISSLTNIKRTTVYDVCEELVGKGYALEDNTKGVTYFSPVPPRELKKITKKERQVLVSKELLLEEVAREMEKLPQSKTYAVPRVRFIEHEENIEVFLYDQTQRWIEGYEEKGFTWCGFQDDTLFAYQPYRTWIDRYWAQVPQSISVELFTNDTAAEEEMREARYPRRNVKYLADEGNFTVTQWIVGDYSVMIQTREKPHYLVETRDAVYANNMRALLKRFWEEIK